MLSKEDYITLKLAGDFQEIVWQHLIATRSIVRFSREQFFTMVALQCEMERKTPKELFTSSCLFFERKYELIWITKSDQLILVGNREDFFIAKIPEYKIEELELIG